MRMSPADTVLAGQMSPLCAYCTPKYGRMRGVGLCVWPSAVLSFNMV